MTYRGDDDAALRRRNELAHVLAAETDAAQRDVLAAEIEAIDRLRIDAARVRLPMVARARIASPCTEAWDTMLGDGAVRSCSRCEKDVFDLSLMTLGQAEALIASRVSEQTCVRLFRRRDGMMFADCEVGARGVVLRTVGAAAAALVIGGGAVAYASAPPPPEPLQIAPSHPNAAALRVSGEAFLHPPQIGYAVGEFDWTATPPDLIRAAPGANRRPAR